MIKLLDVEKIENNRFDILVLCDGRKKRFAVETKEHKTENTDETIWLFVPEDESFFEIWGKSPDFRREVADSIQTLRNNLIPGLKAA